MLHSIQILNNTLSLKKIFKKLKEFAMKQKNGINKIKFIQD